ncbi:serine acetyltransferase [Aliiroseovarius sp. YM-037]|uniref:serine acetyltransferase n=1 Tax=Aliiroseovarius sp. YM-037 TaxID=3341728 RepID=UPI003A7F9D46
MTTSDTDTAYRHRQDPWVSASEADWSREVPRTWWDPSRKLIRSIRRYQALSEKGGVWAKAHRKWWVIVHRFWSIITQSEIDLTAQIGGGLILPHPTGIVIHPDVIIGPNCLIFHHVTIGRTANAQRVATIGGHVDIGAGAAILGPITVSDHVLIGANAVVTHDVPARHVAFGIPAKVRPRDDMYTEKK